MSFNKIKWILGISVVFLLILFTNLIDRHNFQNVQDSITAIYEDRLVAKDLVFELALITRDKEIAMATGDLEYYKSEYIEDHNQIDTLVKIFRTTKLVPQEEKTLGQLESAFNRLEQLEEEKASADNVREDLKKTIDEVQGYLYTLSKIQLDEGKRQLFKGKKALDSVQLLTTMEIYLLVALALIIQILILYDSGKRKT